MEDESDAKYERLVFKGIPKYNYMDISLDFSEVDSKEDLGIDVATFKLMILNALQQLFGEVGKCIAIDILKFDRDRKKALIRVPGSECVKVRASLTLYGEHAGLPCAFRVHQVSSHLMGMAVNSRSEPLIFKNSADT